MPQSHAGVGLFFAYRLGGWHKAGEYYFLIGDQAWRSVHDLDTGEIGGIFVLKIDASRNTGSAAGGGIGARALSHLACKFLAYLPHCDPRLIVLWAGFESQK